ncbi:MAG: genomic island protein [Solimonas sp.]
MADAATLTKDEAVDAVLSDKAIADENWQRYQYALDRGHDVFCREIRRLEDMYFGGGKQWEASDKEVLHEQRRMPIEINKIMPAVNAAVGYQIANRMDIAFQPRGGLATQELANTLSKVAMQIADNCELHWKETQVYSDGLIQRRGFFEIRIDFDDSMRGEVRIDDLDPMDVMPDPDAKGYDPDTWGDVTTSRWYTLDEIEQRYGKKARDKAEAYASTGSEPDHGDDDDTGQPRSKFGDQDTGTFEAIRRDKNLTRLRVIDRQKFVRQLVQVIVTPDTGDIRVVEGMDEAKVQEQIARGGILTKRMARRVRWIVTTYDTTLHDDWSPYPFLTIVPYFAYFRRGRGVGMVDNAVGPQTALNKGVSQYIHIINTAANSGWVVEENSLTNMTTDELENVGAKTGVVIEYKKGSTPPKKIDPAQIPTGLDRIIDRLDVALQENTVPDSARGVDNDTLSGVSRQSKQFAAQQQLAIPIDNLGRTRKMLASRILWCIQNYYDEERVFRITKQNPETGEDEEESLTVNQWDETTGAFLNDLTIGEYDVVISERPMQVTFENGQFEQVKAMRELIGPKLPDDVIVRASSLADKNEVIRRMAKSTDKPDPAAEAAIELTKAQARKADADATAKAVETQFSGVQTAQVIAATPATAPLADSLLRSAGYVDHDAAPIIPTVPAGLDHIAPEPNTNPLTPANPAHADVGMNAGIETPAADSVR